MTVARSLRLHAQKTLVSGSAVPELQPFGCFCCVDVQLSFLIWIIVLSKIHLLAHHGCMISPSVYGLLGSLFLISGFIFIWILLKETLRFRSHTKNKYVAKL